MEKGNDFPLHLSLNTFSFSCKYHCRMRDTSIMYQHKFSKLGDMRGIKLSGLSNNHCLVSFSNTDNYISKCELSNIALLMLCFNFLLVYRSKFGSLNN